MKVGVREGKREEGGGGKERKGRGREARREDWKASEQ